MNYNILCIHYKPLVERKEYILERQKKLNFDVTWIEDEPSQKVFENETPLITKPEFSLWYKHIKAIEYGMKKEDYIVVIEDDIIIPDNFIAMIDQCIIEMEKEKTDIVFIGGTNELQVDPSKIQPNKLVYIGNYTSRCTHAYILNRRKYLTIYGYADPILPMDHLFNKIITEHHLKCGWTHPYLEQKTVLGVEKSSIR